MARRIRKETSVVSVRKLYVSRVGYEALGKGAPDGAFVEPESGDGENCEGGGTKRNPPQNNTYIKTRSAEAREEEDRDE